MDNPTFNLPLMVRQMTEASRRIAKPKPQAATRIGTLGTILAGVDMRTHGGRRFKELCADLVDHLGGDATAPQLAIIRRAAALSVWCEEQEAAQASGGEFDVERFNGATNTLRRLLADLGLERRARDVTPDLATYIKGRAAQKATVGLATGGEHGGRAKIDGSRAEPSMPRPTLADIGVDKKLSSHAQKVAAV